MGFETDDGRGMDFSAVVLLKHEEIGEKVNGWGLEIAENAAL
jgi:hypothetical protein